MTDTETNTVTAAPVIQDNAARDRAVDPQRSCIVQAPAGSGKTTLLARRYVALLATVNQPEEILAITFTKKAAAEMRQRIRQELADETSALGSAARARAEQKHWQLDRYPSRLRIQTIDAFAMSLVKQLPVTSQLPQSELSAHPEECYERAVARVLNRLQQADQDDSGAMIATLLRDFVGNTFQVQNLLVAMLKRREQWQFMLMERLSAFDDDTLIKTIATGVESLQDNAMARLHASLNLPARHSLQQLAQYASDCIDGQTSFNDLNELDQWRFIAEYLVLTKSSVFGKPQVRKRLTKNEGFPSTKDNTHKEELMTLLEEFREQPRYTSMLDALIAVRDVPTIESVELDRGRLVVIGTVLFNCIAELTRLFAERGEVDYNQITIAAITALGTEDAPSDLALSLDYRISHLLIDEFQDTSRAQHELFQRLIREWVPGDGNTFFAVGDPMQSIYRFRNAEVSLFLDVCSDGINNLPLEHLQLSTNFRSSDHMISWFNSVFSDVLGHYDDRNLGAISYASATSPRGTLPVLAEGELLNPLTLSESVAEQHDQIVERINALAEEDSYNDIAVLVRSRKPAGALIHALEQAGIPWQGTDLHALSDTAIVSDLVSLTNTLFDPADRVSAFALLRSPLVGLTLNDLAAVAELWADNESNAVALALTHSPIIDISQQLPTDDDSLEEQGSNGISSDGCARLHRLAELLTNHLAHRLLHSPRELIEGLWLSLGGPVAYPPKTLKHAARALDVIEEGHATRLDVQRLARDIGALYAEDDGTGVQILTVHKSKGLQYRHVLLPHLEAGSGNDDVALLMSRESPKGFLMACRAAGGNAYADKQNKTLYHWLRLEDGQRLHNETKRVLYVAATRAERSLTLFGTLEPGRRPTAKSLLATLEAVFGEFGQDAAETSDVDSPGNTTDPVAGPPLHVLPSTLRPPAAMVPDVELPQRARRSSARRTGEDQDEPDLLFAADRRAAILRGNLTHQALCSLTRALQGTPEASQPDGVSAAEALIAQELPQWQQHVIDQGLSKELALEVANDCQQGILRVAHSPLGYWCALQTHLESHAEYAIRLWENAGPMNLVIDRTFLTQPCERNQEQYRWVIDYKTAAPADAAPDWLSGELTRYTAQLAGYARALIAMYPEHQVRTALYFTATDEFWELQRTPIGDHNAAHTLALENGWVAVQHLTPQ